MLSTKTIYGIYLLHASCGFKYLEEPLPFSADAMKASERLFVEQRLCESGYLDASGNCLLTPSEVSLYDLLQVLGEPMDPCRTFFEGPAAPSSFLSKGLSALEHVSSLWLKSIKLNQL